MTAPGPISLLSKTIPAAVAAQLLGVSPSTFDGMPAASLTLLTAFRGASRAMLARVVKARARKRRPLRQAIAREHRRASAIMSQSEADAALEALRETLAAEVLATSGHLNETLKIGK